MNKTNKPRTLIRSPLIAIPTILLLRVAMTVICSAVAFASDDPNALVSIMAYSAKLISEILSGMIIAKAIGSGFNSLTKVTVASVASLIINVSELLLGKAIYPGAPSALALIPIAAVVCALGAALASKRKITKRRKRIR